MNSVIISHKASVFNGKKLPEEAMIVGYTALIEYLGLAMPFPTTISLISQKNKKYQLADFMVYPRIYQPDETLLKQLIFALKYEGINLLFFKKMFEKISKIELKKMVQLEPSSQYSRKIWFLYEWLMNKNLDLENADVKIKYVNLLDPTQQFALSQGKKSTRHRIINNLPGTVEFCPLIFKTEKLNKAIEENFSQKKDNYLTAFHKDILQRAATFLLLKDSKASFTIEGENPTMTRAVRWGKQLVKLVQHQ